MMYRHTDTIFNNKKISKRKLSYLKIKNIVSFLSPQTSQSHVHLCVITVNEGSQHRYNLLERLFACSVFFSFFSFFF